MELLIGMSSQVHNLSAAYIMKCDDDTFVRVDVVSRQIKKIASGRPLYMGNLNLLHRPLRTGKWAVTFEVSCFDIICTDSRFLCP